MSLRDAVAAAGGTTELVTACEDAAIDAAVKPVIAGEARLIVAAATDAEVRAVVRRMVRILAPPPSKRPAELPADRTVFDLPALGILPLTRPYRILFAPWACRPSRARWPRLSWAGSSAATTCCVPTLVR